MTDRIKTLINAELAKLTPENFAFLGSPTVEEVYDKAAPAFPWGIEDEDDDEKIVEAIHDVLKDLFADAYFRLARSMYDEIGVDIDTLDWREACLDAADAFMDESDWREVCEKDIRHWMTEKYG